LPNRASFSRAFWEILSHLQFPRDAQRGKLKQIIGMIFSSFISLHIA
jgi:hypothetical protein